MNPSRPLTAGEKARLLLRIWWSYLRIAVMSRRPLPEQMRILERRPRREVRPVTPAKLSRAIHRGLRVGPITPRCLPKAMVMFELLRDQGDRPELVIGLPAQATSHEAHAWVELGSVDVGPPPGRSGHDEMVRYGTD